MKRATPFWFGALLVASTGLLYCGGDDTSNPGTPTGTGTGNSGGSGGSGSNTTGNGNNTGITVGTTATTGGPVTSAATTTTGGSGGNAAGGAGGAAAGGSGGTGGGGVGGGKAGGGGATGGGGAGPVIDAGACPGTRPNNGGVCATATQVCSYPTANCTCDPMGGMTRDGGTRNGWACVNIPFDGGGRGGGDAAAGCPANPPNNGNLCPNNAGDVCPYQTRGGALTCTCAPRGGGADRWGCVLGD
jgi:hypothetical protein